MLHYKMGFIMAAGAGDSGIRLKRKLEFRDEATAAPLSKRGKSEPRSKTESKCLPRDATSQSDSSLAEYCAIPAYGNLLNIKPPSGALSLYYSVALSLLLPVVKEDIAKFIPVCHNLFGEMIEESKINELQAELTTYDGETTSDFFERYPLLISLVVDEFCNRVAAYIKGRSEDISEIRAMHELLRVNIFIQTMGKGYKYVDEPSHKADSNQETIHLVMGKKSKNYCFLIEPKHLPDVTSIRRILEGAGEKIKGAHIRVSKKEKAAKLLKQLLSEMPEPAARTASPVKDTMGLLEAAAAASADLAS
jgi:hypothetical protein